MWECQDILIAKLEGFCFQPTAKDARNIKKTEPGDIGLGLWRSKGGDSIELGQPIQQST